ncbi:hypothetical protein Tco_1291142 [Tanacetum coccineum]
MFALSNCKWIKGLPSSNAGHFESFLFVVLAFGRHLKEIHVTWAQFRKKRNNNATLYDFDQEMDLQCVETASQFLLTPSKFQGDNVKVANIEKPREDSAG